MGDGPELGRARMDEKRGVDRDSFQRLIQREQLGTAAKPVDVSCRVGLLVSVTRRADPAPPTRSGTGGKSERQRDSSSALPAVHVSTFPINDAYCGSSMIIARILAQSSANWSALSSDTRTVLPKLTSLGLTTVFC